MGRKKAKPMFSLSRRFERGVTADGSEDNVPLDERCPLCTAPHTANCEQPAREGERLACPTCDTPFVQVCRLRKKRWRCANDHIFFESDFGLQPAEPTTKLREQVRAARAARAQLASSADPVEGADEE